MGVALISGFFFTLFLLGVRCQLLPSSLSGWDVAKVDFFRGEGFVVVSVQLFPSRFFRVTFKVDSVRAKAHFEGLGEIVLDGVVCDSSMCDTFQSFEFMDVRLRSLQCIRILVIYRPPDNNSCLLFFEEFSRLLEQIAAEPSGCLLITGDFNFHMDDPDNANAKRFADLLESYDLKQHVNCGTHTSGHTLDLVITRSDDSLIKDTKVKDPVISDHLAIHCVLSIQKPQFRKKLINVRKLHSLNMDSFCKDIMDSPLLQDQATDLDMMVDQYDRVLRQLLDQHAPKKKRLVTVRPSAPWYTLDVVAEKRKRRRLEQRWRASRLQWDWDQYVRQCCVVNNLTLQSSMNIPQIKGHYLRLLINDFKNHLRSVIHPLLIILL